MVQNIELTEYSDYWCCGMLALTLLSESPYFSDKKTLEEICNAKIEESNMNIYKEFVEKFVSDEKPWTLNEIENIHWFK